MSNIRYSGKVYGDLTGSIFEPQVKSIANVISGTLAVANGGTGKSTPLVADSTTAVNNDTAVTVNITDSGHTHTISNSITGITASSPSHTHTQISHSHNLS